MLATTLTTLTNRSGQGGQGGQHQFDAGSQRRGCELHHVAQHVGQTVRVIELVRSLCVAAVRAVVGPRIAYPCRFEKNG